MQAKLQQALGMLGSDARHGHHADRRRTASDRHRRPLRPHAERALAAASRGQVMLNGVPTTVGRRHLRSRSRWWQRLFGRLTPTTCGAAAR